MVFTVCGLTTNSLWQVDVNKGYLVAFAAFVLGFICVLFLDGGKQFALGFISFMTSLIIGCGACAYQIDKEKANGKS